MAQQNDIQAGFDLSSVNPVSQSQMMQALENLAPLANIGFIIIQATTPDVTNNPRFARYIWLDSSTTPYSPKAYDTGTLAWVALPLAAGAVIAASIANGAVTYNTKIGGFAPAAADALKYLRVDAAGTAVELITLNSAALPTIELSKLTNVGGGVHYFLKWNAAGTALVYEAFDASFIAADAVALTKLTKGSGAQLGFIVRANPTTGVIELVSNDDEVSDFLPVGSATGGIHPSKLSGVGVTSKYAIRWNSITDVWEAVKCQYSTADLTVNGATLLVNAGAHDLGGLPDWVDIAFVCIADNAGHGHAVGDVISESSVCTETTPLPFINVKFIQPGFTTFNIGCGVPAATNVLVANNAGTSYVTYTTVSGSGGLTDFNDDWKVRVTMGKFVN